VDFCNNLPDSILGGNSTLVLRTRPLLVSARGSIIGPPAVEKHLNKDPGNQSADKSRPRPQHIVPHTSKYKHKDAEKTHYGGEKGFQFHPAVE